MVLENFDLEIPAGKTVALVGRNDTTGGVSEVIVGELAGADCVVIRNLIGVWETGVRPDARGAPDRSERRV